MANDTKARASRLLWVGGMEKAEIAEVLNLGVTTVRKYLNNERHVDPDWAKAMADDEALTALRELDRAAIAKGHVTLDETDSAKADELSAAQLAKLGEALAKAGFTL